MRKSHYSIQNQVFLEMLKAWRQDRNLRQTDVGQRLGRDQAMVSKVESGERRLDVIELRAWLAAIDVNFVSFVTELDERIRGSETMKSSVFPGTAVSKARPDLRKPSKVRRGRQPTRQRTKAR